MNTKKFLSTAIGSMPFEDINKAIKIAIESLDAPCWAQLPTKNLREQMEAQYSEAMPCAVLDETKGRLYFNTDCDYSEEFAQFYDKYINAIENNNDDNCDLDFIKISKDYASGLHGFLNKCKIENLKFDWLKLQITGAISFALSITDENKRAIYYNEEFRDMIVKVLSLKAKWQVREFKKYCENIICFIDEPILSAFGSSTYVSVSREEVVGIMREMIEAIKEENNEIVGAIVNRPQNNEENKFNVLVGVHCCGNTDWSLLIEAGADIINFDAFEFGETIALYANEIKGFLSNGGYLAWGIVPTSPIIREQTAESLKVKLNERIDFLAAKGIDRDLIVAQSMITPSCGTGTLEECDAERVFVLLKELTELLRG